MKIDGMLLVTDTAVDIDVNLPFMAQIFEGAIRGEWGNGWTSSFSKIGLD